MPFRSIKGLFDIEQLHQNASLRMRIRQKEDRLLTNLKQYGGFGDQKNKQSLTTCLWLSRAYFQLAGKDVVYKKDFNKALRIFSSIQHRLLTKNSVALKQAYLQDLLLSRRAKKGLSFGHKYQYLQAMLFQQMALLMDSSVARAKDLLDTSMLNLEELFSKFNCKDNTIQTLLQMPISNLFIVFNHMSELIGSHNVASQVMTSRLLLEDERVAHCGVIYEHLSQAFKEKGFILTFSFEEMIEKVLGVQSDSQYFCPSNQDALDELFTKLEV